MEGIEGSSADDRLTGAVGPNLLVGLEGDDLLGGGRGGDVLNGGPGSDRLHGGRSKDDSTHYLFETELETGIEADLAAGKVSFGADRDSLAGIEILLGTNQDDEIRGGPRRDLSGRRMEWMRWTDARATMSCFRVVQPTRS